MLKIKTAGIYYNPKDKGPREDRCYWSPGTMLDLSNGIWSHRGDSHCRDSHGRQGEEETPQLSPSTCLPVPSVAPTLLLWEPGTHGLQGESKGWPRPDRRRWPRSFIQFLSHLTAQKWEGSVSLSPVSRGKWAYVFATATKMMTDGGTWLWILKGGKV